MRAGQEDARVGRQAPGRSTQPQGTPRTTRGPATPVSYRTGWGVVEGVARGELDAGVGGHEVGVLADDEDLERGVDAREGARVCKRISGRHSPSVSSRSSGRPWSSSAVASSTLTCSPNRRNGTSRSTGSTACPCSPRRRTCRGGCRSAPRPTCDRGPPDRPGHRGGRHGEGRDRRRASSPGMHVLWDLWPYSGRGCSPILLVWHRSVTF